ncbi:MAG: sigma-70 family RNA polymerase sigma factor [Bacteroidota bacterium]
MTDTEFAALHAQIMADDPRGLQQVFQECSQYCLGTLRKKTQCDKADAEDVLMEAVLSFRSNMQRGKISEISNLKAYLFGICWNKWRELQRARDRFQPEANPLERSLYFVIEGENPLIEQEEWELDQRRIKSQLQAAEQALSALKEKCRKLMRYFYMEGRNLEDIASMLGFANANVAKVSRFRCYQQWMKAIEKQKNIAQHV